MHKLFHVFYSCIEIPKPVFYIELFMAFIDKYLGLYKLYVKLLRMSVWKNKNPFVYIPKNMHLTVLVFWYNNLFISYSMAILIWILSHIEHTYINIDCILISNI